MREVPRIDAKSFWQEVRNTARAHEAVRSLDEWQHASNLDDVQEDGRRVAQRSDPAASPPISIGPSIGAFSSH